MVAFQMNRLTSLAALVLLLCLTALPIAAIAADEPPAAASEPSLVALGERLYKTGIGTSGEPVAAIDLSGQRVFAPQFHCVACHRTSGFGSKEGGVYIPPIVGKVLYAPMVPDRARSFSAMYFQDKNIEGATRVSSARTRPPYDLETLGRLLRTGVDSAGEPVPHAMPRFEVSPRDVEALDAWLHALSGQPDPGVDGTAINFAVIVSDRTPALTKQALLETSRVFFERINKNIANDRSKPNFSTLFRSEFESFWRNWTLQVWTLKGDESTWPDQLTELYNASPVFAVIGGSVTAPWQPIGEFCDSKKMPCLFPLTDMPAEGATTGGYTLYSYGGLPLEAAAMAEYLTRDGKIRPIVQLAVDSPNGSIPAAALVEHLDGLEPRMAVDTIRVTAGDWDRAIASASGQLGNDSVLVVWPGADAEAAVAALARVNPAASLVMMASASEPFAVTQLTGSPIAQKVRMMHPTELPGVVEPHSYRVRSWLNARQVAIDPPEEQFQIYYGLSVLEKAVMEIQGDYSREYLIEQIEMIAESNLSPGVFPELTLGPGQRIASRGSYVVKLDPSGDGGLSPDGDWIVP